MFLLKYYAGFSLIESYNLPVGLLKWFTKKLIEQKETEAKTIEKSHKKK